MTARPRSRTRTLYVPDADRDVWEAAARAASAAGLSLSSYIAQALRQATATETPLTLARQLVAQLAKTR